MKILSLEASGNDCSVALCVDGQWYEKSIEAPRRQGALLLPMVEEALEAMQLNGGELDGIVFGRGPGSFTGIRLTAGVVQGLAVGWNKKVLPVSHLAALAYKQYCLLPESLAPVFVAIDARKQEVYAAEYQFKANQMVVTYPEQVIAPEHLPLRTFELSLPPAASDILRFACYQLENGAVWMPPDQIELAYLRNKVTD
jgi:tRNA threonylcarbamoyladenosine biosynthesis protein TsaB